MFDTDFQTAYLEDGETTHFTEAESTLLKYITRHPGQVLSRGQILDATTGPGSDKNDRNVDFLINRIRRKLRDNARNPKFIATRYGGGYVWLVQDLKKMDTSSEPEGIFLVLGPVKGLELLSETREAATAFTKLLGDAFRTQLGEERRVVVAPEPEALRASCVATPSIQVEPSFFGDQAETECVVKCRSHHTGRIFHIGRFSLSDDGPPFARLSQEAGKLASKILAKRWRVDTDHIASESPLPVAMYQAAIGGKDSRQAWVDIDPRIRALRAEQPDDPEIKLLHATHLHSNYVVRGYNLFQKGEENCAEDEAEIEKLVIQSLDYAQQKPELAMVAAKLLYFVDRNYGQLALEIATEAHNSSLSVASTLTILGQLRTFMGDMDQGVDDLRQAAALTEEGTLQRVYTTVLLCQALIASGRREELKAPRDEVYSWDPRSRILLEILFTDPDSPSLRARGVMLTLTKAKARALLLYKAYISSRHYVVPQHRANSIQTPLSLCVRRFGRSIIPPEVSALVPDMLA